MDVNQDDDDDYNDEYDYVDLDNLQNDQQQYFLQNECNNGSEYENDDEV